MAEKRRCQRLSKPSIVRFKLLKGHHLGMSSRSEDFCEEGMRLLTLQRLLPGMTLNLNFQLQEYSTPISATAKVVWQNDRDNMYYPFMVGLKFTKIDAIDRQKIRNYINLSSRESRTNAQKPSR